MFSKWPRLRGTPYRAGSLAKKRRERPKCKEPPALKNPYVGRAQRDPSPEVSPRSIASTRHPQRESTREQAVEKRRERPSAGRAGAQEPECTRSVHEDSEHRVSPDQGRAVVFQQPARCFGRRSWEKPPRNPSSAWRSSRPPCAPLPCRSRWRRRPGRTPVSAARNRTARGS